jgi:putative ABC transport system permease protein
VQKQPHGFGMRNRAKYEKRKNFTAADVVLLEDHCAECLRVAGEAWAFAQQLSTSERQSTSGSQVAGGTVYFFDNNGFGLARGRLLSEADLASAADVAVIGPDVADVLFPGEEPLGQELRIRQRSYRIVGVMERRGSMMGGGSMDNLAVLPLSTFMPVFGERQSLNVTIQARDPARMTRAQDEVVALLRRARGVPPEAENDFEMFSNNSMQEEFERISGSIAAASIGICAIALLIGGIGVMNIMLVSVTERTSEIGLRRALGARRKRILGQFVTEAIALTSLGGALGVAAGGGVAGIVRIMVGLPTVVPLWAVVLAMITAAGTGLIFGIYPAWRASMLDPVEAMRHE